MSSTSPVVYVEGLREKQIAEAILQSYQAEVNGGHTTSGAISAAEGSLLDHPERPVALLLNTETENPRQVNDLRATCKRILARAYPENWCVAVAVPYLDAWAMTDPRIAQDLASYMDGKHRYTDRAARIAEITKRQPFDPTNLLQQSPDFRTLVEFLQKHTRAPAEQVGKAAGS